MIQYQYFQEFKRMIRDSLRRHIIEPTYEIANRSSKLNFWKQLEKTQWLPSEYLQSIQWERFKDLIYFAYSYNNYYRKRFDSAGLHPKDIREPRDVTAIPILSKIDIRDHKNSLITNNIDSTQLVLSKTGGSTGKALHFYISETTSELRNACAWRHNRWAGWEIGSTMGAAWGNPVRPFSLLSKIRLWSLAPMIWLDTMRINDQAVFNFAREWQKIKPTILFGHAHSLFVLANFVEQLGIDYIIPKGIISTSMMLLPHERRRIEAVFPARVFDRYGCEEVGLIASECDHHSGLHLNIDQLFVEFLDEDGSPAAPGQPGKLVITDLLNYAMPFIRYSIEDVGVLSSRPCSCGRGLPLLESITGRVADFLVRSDGSLVAGVSLIENTLTNMPGIDQMQLIQENDRRLRIRLVCGKEFTKKTAQLLLYYFQDQFGTNTLIELEYVQHIHPEKNGKYRFSICNIGRPTYI